MWIHCNWIIGPIAIEAIYCLNTIVLDHHCWFNRNSNNMTFHNSPVSQNQNLISHFVNHTLIRILKQMVSFINLQMVTFINLQMVSVLYMIFDQVAVCCEHTVCSPNTVRPCLHNTQSVRLYQMDNTCSILQYVSYYVLRSA